ncbi:MAG: RNA polymerase sigma factor [Solirubrobacteraceae bacterium]
MGASPARLVEDLFRTEHAHLVAALARVLGPANLQLAEDVVQDALVSAMQAWRFGPPRDPKAWIVRAARNRAVDIIRRERRGVALLPELAGMTTTAETIDAVLAPAANASNQLAMMFAVCEPALTSETHVTMILRWLCGLSPKEIGQAFLVDTPTIDRRLHRGRGRVNALGRIVDIDRLADLGERQGSVLQALYLLFSEGYHGSSQREPVRPFLCTDAIRLTELLLETHATAHLEVSALAALFYFDLARLSTRLDAGGVFVPLDEQDRTRWDSTLIQRGLAHLAASAGGESMSRWHLEAGIACEHALAPSVRQTNWSRIIAFYDLLMAQSPGPIVALNRALAVAQRDGVEEGRRQLVTVASDKKLGRYPFYWAALADLQRRAGQRDEAQSSYERAIELSRSAAERDSYRRRIDRLKVL